MTDPAHTPTEPVPTSPEPRGRPGWALGPTPPGLAADALARAATAASQDGSVEVIREKPLGIQVCAEAGIDPRVLVAAANRLVECGTTEGWHLVTDVDRLPVPCLSRAGRLHYVLDA
jgi:hypothetical protein